MNLEHVLHVNIRCAESDLPEIERFYSEVLDLKKGYRPNFKFGGLWLYDKANNPIVHVSGRFPEGSFVKDSHNGSVDHIAFKASGSDDLRKRLKACKVEFEEQNIENAGYQFFFYDPVGTKIELNFAGETPQDAVAVGTTAEANMR